MLNGDSLGPCQNYGKDLRCPHGHNISGNLAEGVFNTIHASNQFLGTVTWDPGWWGVPFP